MSLNSYATKDQLEIGRAQAVQAEACGIECTTDMNPILLKPTSHTCSQVVLNGKPSGNKNAAEYCFVTIGRENEYPGWEVVERGRRDGGIKIAHPKHPEPVVLYPEDDAYGEFSE